MAIDTRLLALLQSGIETTQAEAAERLGVSQRSVRRYLKEMERLGRLDIRQDGPTKRYRLKPEHLPTESISPTLTEREAQALTVACLASKALLKPTPFARPLERAHSKFEQAWLARTFSFEPDDETGRWSFEGATGGQPPPFDRALFTALLEAVREVRPIEVSYYSASRDALSEGRRLHPLGFHVRAGSWMLAAEDPEKPAPAKAGGDIRDFSLAGFRNVKVMENETFAPPPSFSLAEHTRHRFRALAGEGDYTVRLAVEAGVVPYFHRKNYHPSQKIEEKADGSAVVSWEIQGLDDMAAWVRSWGPLVRVLEPEALARRVREDAEETIELYR